MTLQERIDRQKAEYQKAIDFYQEQLAIFQERMIQIDTLTPVNNQTIANQMPNRQVTIDPEGTWDRFIKLDRYGIPQVQTITDQVGSITIPNTVYLFDDQRAWIKRYIETVYEVPHGEIIPAI